jgi:hypothetical protein
MYGEWVIAQHILNLSAGWMSVLSFTLQPLYPKGKILCYLLFGRQDDSRTHLVPVEIEKARVPARN